MTESMRPTPAEIRAYRAENPKLRERDIAAQLGISEAALVAAECGLTAIRIESSANRFLERAEELGEVLALTRNESAVHEKVGLYENVKQGHAATLVLGSEIDLRVFPGAWEHGFAVTKTDAKGGGSPQPAVFRQMGQRGAQGPLAPCIASRGLREAC